MACITKQMALDIARKLKANIDTTAKAHDLATVLHEGKVIAWFGIRRGSKRDLPHPYIPAQIHLGPHDTRRLAECHISREEWIAIMREKGLIA